MTPNGAPTRPGWSWPEPERTGNPSSPTSEPEVWASQEPGEDPGETTEPNRKMAILMPAIAGTVSSLMALLISFGFDISVEQREAVTATVGALGILIAAVTSVRSARRRRDAPGH